MPTHHHIKILPITVIEFVKRWGLEHQTKRIIMTEYDHYLNANKDIHHYGDTTGIGHWSRLQRNSYKSYKK